MRALELHDPALAGRWQWTTPAGVRDVPCSWDAMVENTLDPAHFCSAHHGTLGNRYEDPKYYRMEVSRPVSLEAGFAADIRRSEGGGGGSSSSSAAGSGGGGGSSSEVVVEVAVVVAR